MGTIIAFLRQEHGQSQEASPETQRGWVIGLKD